MAGRPVNDFVAIVVGEQVSFGHVLFVGRVRQSRDADGAHRQGREHVQHEIRPALAVRQVNGTDQYHGHCGYKARDRGRGQCRLFGLYPRRHTANVCAVCSENDDDDGSGWNANGDCRGARSKRSIYIIVIILLHNRYLKILRRAHVTGNNNNNYIEDTAQSKRCRSRRTNVPGRINILLR